MSATNEPFADEAVERQLEDWRHEAPPPLSARVCRAVGDHPSAVKPIWPTWARFAVAAGSGAFTTILIAVATRPAWSHVAHRDVLPGWWWLVTLAAWVVCALLLTWMAVCEAGPEAPVKWGSRLAAILGLAAGFAVMAVVTDLLVSHGAHTAAAPVPSGARCLTVGTAVELAPVLVVFLLVARGAPFHPVRAGALAGVAAGAWALVILQVNCPSTAATHNILYHLGVAGIWGLLGSGAGLWLAWRSHAAEDDADTCPDGEVPGGA